MFPILNAAAAAGYSLLASGLSRLHRTAPGNDPSLSRVLNYAAGQVDSFTHTSPLEAAILGHLYSAPDLGKPNPVAAQGSQPNPIPLADLQTFHQFLQTHRDIREQLPRNPSLVNDPKYLDAHPELKEFLQDHPQTAQELRRNPSALVAQEILYGIQQFGQ